MNQTLTRNFVTPYVTFVFDLATSIEDWSIGQASVICISQLSGLQLCVLLESISQSFSQLSQSTECSFFWYISGG